MHYLAFWIIFRHCAPGLKKKDEKLKLGGKTSVFKPQLLALRLK